MMATRFLSAREITAQLASFDYIIGIDEAGRGPICGPVTAAAFCWRRPMTIGEYDWAEAVADSKAMKEGVRERVYAEMKQDFEEQDDGDYTYAFVSADEKAIDDGDILKSTLDCMFESFKKVFELIKKAAPLRPDTQIRVFIDGNHIPPQMQDIPNVKTTCVIKGDSEIFTISCASIVAKCARDHMMRELAKQYPQYGIDIHKGYLTAMHKEALAKYGPSAIHRLTFEPCKSMLMTEQFPIPEGRSIDCVVRKVQAKLKTKSSKPKQESGVGLRLSVAPDGTLMLQPK